MASMLCHIRHPTKVTVRHWDRWTLRRSAHNSHGFKGQPCWIASILGSLVGVGAGVLAWKYRYESIHALPSPLKSPADRDQPDDQSACAALEKTIAECRKTVLHVKEQHKCPGLCIAVAVNGTTVWAEGMGYADVENRVPCSVDTVMKIASISKPITMTILGKVWERGGLDLDADVKKYVPYWPDKHWENRKVAVTTRQLGSHLGGVRHYKKIQRKEKTEKKEVKVSAADCHQEFGFEEYYIKDKYKSVKDSMQLFIHDPLIHKPGTAFTYTNHGFTVISAVLEGATGHTFSKLVSGLFKDLGMEHSYIDDREQLIYNRASYYTINKHGGVSNAPFMEASFKIAGAGMLSCVTDLAKFANAILYSYQWSDDCTGTVDDQYSNGVLRKTGEVSTNSTATNEQLPGYLQASTVRMLWDPIPNTTVSWATRGEYALGWQVVPAPYVPTDSGNATETVPGGKNAVQQHEAKFIVGHTGGTVGASCALMILPKTHRLPRSSTRELLQRTPSLPPEGVVVAILANMQGLSLGPVASQIAQVFETFV